MSSLTEEFEKLLTDDEREAAREIGATLAAHKDEAIKHGLVYVLEMYLPGWPE